MSRAELLYRRDSRSRIADLWLGRADVPAFAADAARGPAWAAAIAEALVLTGHEQDASRVARQAWPTAAAAIATALHSMGQTAKAREKAQAACRQLMQHSQLSAAIDVARALAVQGGFEGELHELARLADSTVSSGQAPSGSGDARRALLRAAELHALAGEPHQAWQSFNALGSDLDYGNELFLDFALADCFDDSWRALFLPKDTRPSRPRRRGGELLWSRGDVKRARRWISVAIRLSKLKSWSGAEQWAITTLAGAVLRNGFIDTVLANVGSSGKLRDALLIEIAQWNATELRYEAVKSLLEMVDDTEERAKGYATCAVAAAKNRSEEWFQRFARQAEDILAALPESSRQSARFGVALRLAVAVVNAETIERFTSGMADWEIKGTWGKYVDCLVDQGRLAEARLVASARGIESRKLSLAKLREDVRTLGLADIVHLLRQMSQDEYEMRFDQTVTDQVAIVESLIQVGRLGNARALVNEMPEADRDEALTALVRAEAAARHATDASQLISEIHEPRWQALAEAAVFANEEQAGQAALHRLVEFLRQMESRFIDRDRAPALTELALSLKSHPELALLAARSALSASASKGEHELFWTLRDLVPVLEALPDKTVIKLVFIRLLDLSERFV